MQRNNRTWWLVSAAALALLCIVKLYDLGGRPAGVYLDEASIAYNAWSLAETGRDEHGVAWPMFTRCFGNHQDPVYIYSLTGLLKLFPLSLTLVRLPSAIFSILAGLAFALLVYEHTRRRWWALAGGFIFAVLPWGFPVSRYVASGYTAYLLGLCLGWWCLLRAARLRSWRYAVGAAAAWSFAMHAHNVARPFVVPLLLLFVVCLYRVVWRRRRTALIFAGSLIAFMLPMSWVVLHNRAALTERFSQLAVWHDGAPVGTILGRMAHRYITYWSPGFLFAEGPPWYRHHTGVGGVLFAFMLPLVLIGLWHCLRHWRHPYYRFILAALLLFPLPAILTIDFYHPMRVVQGMVPLTLVAMIGAVQVTRRGPRWRLGLRILMVLGALNIGGYLAHYFSDDYQRWVKAEFDYAINDALATAGEQAAPGEPIYISPTFFYEPVYSDFTPFKYVTILYQLRIPPDVYQAEGMPRDRVRPYVGRLPEAGLLLRGTLTRRFTDAGIVVEPNPVPLPAGAELIAEWPLSREYVAWQYINNFGRPPSFPPGLQPALQLYRVPPSNP